jgi:hypothetical protein
MFRPPRSAELDTNDLLQALPSVVYELFAERRFLQCDFLALGATAFTGCLLNLSGV